MIGIFPNAKSCIRYVNCLLMEIDEDWQTGRRYMRMKYLEEEKPEIEENFMEEIQKVKEVSSVIEKIVAQ